MYTDFYQAENPEFNTPLCVRTIYRVLADNTYQARHPAEEEGKQIFVYTDQGQGFLHCGAGDFVLEADTMLVFAADMPYDYRTTENQWNFWWFEFRGDDPCQRGVLYSMDHEKWMGQLCEKALNSLRTGTASAASYLSCLLAMCRESAGEEKNAVQDVFLQAQALIRENLYHINVSSLSQMLNVDPRTVYNLFMRYAGCSPKAYIRSYVMDKARYLLTNTTKSIGEISEEMGFSNAFHFSRVFKEAFGLSPRSYRDKICWKEE